VVLRPPLSRPHLVDAGYAVPFATAVMPLQSLVESGFATMMSRQTRFLMLSSPPIGPQVAVIAVILIGIGAMNWAGHADHDRWFTLGCTPRVPHLLSLRFAATEFAMMAKRLLHLKNWQWIRVADLTVRSTHFLLNHYLAFV
jgi:hypothetical protein